MQLEVREIKDGEIKGLEKHFFPLLCYANEQVHQVVLYCIFYIREQTVFSLLPGLELTWR